MFLWYLLLCLLQAKQVVLVHMPDIRPLLFFHDKVYLQPQPTSPEEAFEACETDLLPEVLVDDAFIWSLYDAEKRPDPPPLATCDRCFVVQTPSTRPSRTQWIQTRLCFRSAALPLWTRQELRDA